MERKRLLWIGDAACSTGFARVTHNVLDRIHSRWRVGVLGTNFRGDPHRYDYPIWRADRDGDTLGLDRAADLVAKGEPDVVFIHQDPWWVCGYLDAISRAVLELGAKQPRVVAFMPIDTQGELRASQVDVLSRLDMALFYTEFGARHAREMGLSCPTGSVGLGVDTEFFHPIERSLARRRTGLDALVGDGFLLGNVNRNQMRKRLDLSVRAFAEWRRKYGRDDAYLYFHTNRIEMGGWNLNTVATYYGVEDYVLYPTTMDGWDGTDADLMSSIYSSFDVQISTTLGEGWGLTQLEGLACGVPQIAPDWSALGEWLRRGSILVPCSDTQMLTGIESNGVGGVVDVNLLIEAVDRLYRDRDERARLSRDARSYAREDRFSWETTAAVCERALEAVLKGEVSRAA